ncbi:MAG: phosphate/phosphite/phosphonate ABC transporter substrate-binding protein [Thermonemataceae bacterium]|nr:phosphate/phosphite/phosphonate ABC transporter substrate-binding protein [Thermonemataceae bacterium]
MKKIALFSFLMLLWANYIMAQKVLYLGVGSNIAKSAEKQQLVEELALYLSQKTGVSVKISSVKPGKTLEAIQEGKLDVALMNTFGYVLASGEGNMEGLAVVANAQKEAISYKSCLLSSSNSNIKNISDLKKEATNSVFGFVTSSSTSGHLVPRLFLNRQDLQPEIAFKDIKFTGSHSELIHKISTNELKVGACSYTDLEEMVKEGKYKMTDFNILWVSEPITNGPVSVRKNLPTNTKNKLLEAWLALPKENPALNAKIVKIWHNTDANSIFVPAQDKLYDAIRNMANSMEEISILVGMYSE